MLIPWSISTAVRNPERLRGFLQVLADMAGKCWRDCQADFQVRLIQRRLYGASNPQFYNGLSQEHVDLIESGRPISLRAAREIFNSKNYEDPSMRGRQSFKPLQRFGFASVENERIRITSMGEKILADDWEKSDVFLRAMLKWQLPNPLDRNFRGQDGYNIKPFVGVLRLMDAVSRLEKDRHLKAKGLWFIEFRVFAMTLIDWRDIESVAEEIIQFRRELAAVPYDKLGAFADYASARRRPNFNRRNIIDSTWDTMVAFEATGYVHLMNWVWGHRIAIVPAQKRKLDILLAHDNAEPISDFADLGGSYINYLGATHTPGLSDKNMKKPEKAIRSPTKAKRKIALLAPA